MARLFVALAVVSALVSARLRAEDSSEIYPQWDGKESIDDYAKRTKLERSVSVDLGDGVKLEFLLVPAGSFTMGSPKEEDKRPQDGPNEIPHKVTLTKPFYLGKFELTQAQYEKIVGTNPSTTKDEKLPVTDIVWDDAVTFCTKASEKTHQYFALPTEAQWEFACRAGTQTAYVSGNDEAALDKDAWYGKNSEGKLHAGGEKAANAFGFYDMLGNVREFCADYFAEYEDKEATDPTGPAQGDKRISRGGAYAAVTHLICRCASRTPEPLTRKNAIIGMRPVLRLPVKK